MKHKKNSCTKFLNNGFPCDDCDLEGHSITCGWHRDWHSCNCGALDTKPHEWHNCPRCDALYEDQNCICKVLNEKDSL